MHTILIVDSECSGEQVASALGRRGFNALVVARADKALGIVRSDAAVDMVIMELQLPDMEGIDLLAELRRCRPGLPVLVVTARGSIESYLHAVSMGVIEYLSKPVTSRDLTHIVQDIFDRRDSGISFNAA